MWRQGESKGYMSIVLLCTRAISRSMCQLPADSPSQLTWSTRIGGSFGPLYALASSVASYCFHASLS